MPELIDPDIFEDLKIAVDNKNIDSIVDNFNKLGYNRHDLKHNLNRQNHGSQLAEYCNLILFVIQKNKSKAKTD